MHKNIFDNTYTYGYEIIQISKYIWYSYKLWNLDFFIVEDHNYLICYYDINVFVWQVWQFSAIFVRIKKWIPMWFDTHHTVTTAIL